MQVRPLFAIRIVLSVHGIEKSRYRKKNVRGNCLWINLGRQPGRELQGDDLATNPKTGSTDSIKLVNYWLDDSGSDRLLHQEWNRYVAWGIGQAQKRSYYASQCCQVIKLRNTKPRMALRMRHGNCKPMPMELG